MRLFIVYVVGLAFCALAIYFGNYILYKWKGNKMNKTIEQAEKECREAWKQNPSDYGWCIHHEIEMEKLTEPIENRISFILKYKATEELITRLDNLRPVISPVAIKAKKAYEEAIAPAKKAYDEAIASAKKTYDEAIAPAWKAYEEAAAPGFEKAYDEAVASARKAYEEAIALAWKAYEEAIAPALGVKPTRKP